MKAIKVDNPNLEPWGTTNTIQDNDKTMRLSPQSLLSNTKIVTKVFNDSISNPNPKG